MELQMGPGCYLQDVWVFGHTATGGSWVVYRCVLTRDALGGCESCHCNGPGVVQRRDRQKKEFHDQSDYR